MHAGCRWLMWPLACHEITQHMGFEHLLCATQGADPGRVRDMGQTETTSKSGCPRGDQMTPRQAPQQTP